MKLIKKFRNWIIQIIKNQSKAYYVNPESKDVVLRYFLGSKVLANQIPKILMQIGLQMPVSISNLRQDGRNILKVMNDQKEITVEVAYSSSLGCILEIIVNDGLEEYKYFVSNTGKLIVNEKTLISANGRKLICKYDGIFENQRKLYFSNDTYLCISFERGNLQCDITNASEEIEEYLLSLEQEKLDINEVYYKILDYMKFTEKEANKLKRIDIKLIQECKSNWFGDYKICHGGFEKQRGKITQYIYPDTHECIKFDNDGSFHYYTQEKIIEFNDALKKVDAVRRMS